MILRQQQKFWTMHQRPYAMQFRDNSKPQLLAVTKARKYFHGLHCQSIHRQNTIQPETFSWITAKARLESLLNMWTPWVKTTSQAKKFLTLFIPLIYETLQSFFNYIVYLDLFSDQAFNIAKFSFLEELKNFFVYIVRPNSSYHRCQYNTNSRSANISTHQ